MVRIKVNTIIVLQQEAQIICAVKKVNITKRKELKKNLNRKSSSV
jgi:hypothetical protein